MSTISQGANDVRLRARQGAVGQKVFSQASGERLLTAINEDPQAVQVDDWTVVASNDATYTVTIDGIDAVFTADGSATTEEIRDGLILAINEEPLIRGKLIPTIKDADEFTTTGLTPDLSYTTAGAATAGSLTPASVASAAGADPIAFGRLVIDDGSPDPYGNTLLGRLAKSTAFVAQVLTLNTIFVASATYTVTVRDEAGAVIAQAVAVDADTNDTDTATAIAAALNGLLPANSVVVTSGAGPVIFTAELAGREFSVEAGTNEEGEAGGALVSQVNTTGPSNATSVNRAALGVSLFSDADPTPTIGGTVGEYAGGDGVELLKSGNSIWVDRPGAVTFGDPVFVELDGTGSDAAKFFLADSATRVLLTKATWLRDGVEAASDIISALTVDF